MVRTDLPFLAYTRFIALFCAAFFPVYALGAMVRAHAAAPWRLYFSWERHIPIVEWAVIPYLTLFPSYAVPLFVMDERSLLQLTRQSLIAIGICGAAFVLLPTTSGFVDPLPTGPLRPLFTLIHSVDGPHNMVPSLHVAGGTIVLLGSAQMSGKKAAWVLRVWLAAMISSTVLVHQHHLLDVLAGLAVAAVARRLIPLEPRPGAYGQTAVQQ